MKKLFSILIAVIMLVSCMSFSPLAANESEIMTLLAELNIMNGDPDGNLRLYDYVSRAEFTKIAVASSLHWKSVGEGLSISPFKDVKSDHWASPYIFTGVTLNLCKGFPDGTFNPDGTILYEEALTILLRVLGYSDSDFGYSWPYGQIGLAKNLEITDNVDKKAGDVLTRYDVANLVYNCLDTKYKGEIFKLITSFDCRITEEQIIIATNKQDSSIPNDRIFTGIGSLKIKNPIDDNLIGRRGSIVTKNTNDFVAFFPEEQTIDEYTITDIIGKDLLLDGNAMNFEDSFDIIYKTQITKYPNAVSTVKKGDKFFLYRNESGSMEYARIEAQSNLLEVKNLEKHIVYSQLNDTAITYCNGVPSQIELKNDIDIYVFNARSNLAALKSQMEIGDVIYVKYDNLGKIDYISFEKGSIDGPVTITAHSGGYHDDATIIRNGVSGGNLQENDIAYYSKDLNLVLAYNNSKTGVYENAYPNKDMPTSVVISGVTYQLEGSNAFKKLSSTGSFNYGDTVKILLGKSNQIADVVSLSDTKTTVVGYLIETGEKSYTLSDGNNRIGFYAKLALPNGEVYEYITERNYDNIKNSVVKLTFNNSIAKAERASGVSASGNFNWSSKRFGGTDVSKDIKIIDVNTTEILETGAFAKIYPQRLNDINISQSNVLYCEKNNSGEIISLILKDVTGDSHTYGLITSADKDSFRYSFNIGRETRTVVTPGTTFSVTAGQAARFRLSPAGSVELMRSIERIPDTITRVTETSLTTGRGLYLLSDKVLVYNKNYEWEYNIIPLSEITGNTSKYTLTAFYDKPASDGGRVRVIIAQAIK